MESTFEGIEVSDYIVIAGYFIFVLAVGLYSSWKSQRDSVGGYFMASRSMHWIPVGASLFASNIGSGHFIGLAGTGAASGIGIAAFELSAIYFILMLGWLFVPVYMSSGVFTMPEYLRKRFGGQRIRIYLSVLALLLYIFTKISADLFAGAIFITQATKQTSEAAIYISILILLAIACLFTVAGGLTAVIWTDFVQTVLMIVGAFVLCGQAFVKVGGYENLVSGYFEATASVQAFKVPGDNSSGLCGAVPQDAMHLFRSNVPGESDLPWTGVLFGLTVSSIWYWCSDQVIVQRALSSKTMGHAKGGCILASWLKLLPLWLMVFPGMAARVLFPDEVGCADPDICEQTCGSRSGCTNLAFVKLVNELLPVGLRGLMLAVMLSALMSSLTSIFNSSSTIFTMDIYTRIRPKASEKELLYVGRIFVFVLVGISVVWIPIINASQGSQLFVYIQSITSYLAPPICAIYLLAIFWERTTEPGAFWGLMVGLIVGLIRFALEFGYSIPACGDPLDSPRAPPDWWYTLIGNIHYLHFGVILFFISGLVAMSVSLLTAPIDRKHLHRLTFWTRHSREVRIDLDEDTQYNTSEKTGKTEVEKAQEAAEFLEEPIKLKYFVNVNAAIIMTITAFLWGFYA